MPLEEEFFDVGQRILELRGGFTQAEFSARLGVDRKTVVGWEAGKRLPDGASLRKLAREFGADLNYLIEGKRSNNVSLSAEEATLLQYFREAAPAVRKAAIGALLSGSSSGAMTMSNLGDGNVQIGSGSFGGSVSVKKGR